MNRTLLVCAALGSVLLTGCGTPAPSPSPSPAPTVTATLRLATGPDDLIGIWQLGSGPRALFFQFDEDGVYRTALGVVTNLEASPQHYGQYLFNDGMLTFVTDDRSAMCAGQNGTYEVRRLDQESLGLFLREDQCSL